MKKPIPSRPQTDPSYGISQDMEGMLEWDWVVEKLPDARSYWLATVRPDGRPHVVPVWGVWLDDTMYFGMGAETIKARNLRENPNVVLHLDSSEDVVIFEGVAEEINDEGLQERIDDAYEAKYDIRHGTPVFGLRLKKAFAWQSNKFAESPTRWVFGD